MKFREFTFIPEDKDMPIKVVYEDDNGFIEIDDCIIEYSRKLSPTEAEKVFIDMFGTTNIGILDCSSMTDEEINKTVDKWNSIPEEYVISIEDWEKPGYSDREAEELAKASRLYI